MMNASETLETPAARRRESSAPGWIKPAAVAAGVAGACWLLRKATELQLRDRVVVITGGSRGLGLLMAQEFAHCGARVAICARDEAELARAHDLLTRDGADVLAVRCDVTDREQVLGLVEQVLAHFGRIDVFVNNAGLIEVGPFDNMTEAEFARALDVMFWAVLHGSLAVLPHMRARGSGRIVNITSIGGMVSVPHLLPYNCAKFAAVGLSQGLRAALHGTGVRVTTIVPGTMRLGSHVRAHFRGQAAAEYAWFSLAASLPLVSVSGRRAARQVVQATRRGEALRTLGLPAKVLERLHGLFPGLTADILGLVARLLPGPDARNAGSSPGVALDAGLRSRVLRTLTETGRRAAQRNNEFGD